MTRRDHLDPLLAERMEEVLADLATSPDRASAPARPRRTGIVVTGVVAFALAVLTVAVLVATSHRSTPPATSSTVAPTVTVDGTAIPYAGRMPWYGAVRDPNDDRALTIHADGDLIKGPVFLCGLPEAEHAVVRETETEVVIEAVGYAAPLPGDLACAGVGHGLQPLTVRLRQPLGDRVVRDAVSDAERHVLDASVLPSPSFLPDGFVEDPDSPRWVGGYDMLSATWRNGAVGTRSPQTIAVRVGDGDSRGASGPDGPADSTITVQEQPAELWQDGDARSSYWRVDVHWKTPDGLPAVLQYEGTRERHLTLAQVVRVAESLHE